VTSHPDVSNLATHDSFTAYAKTNFFEESIEAWLAIQSFEQLQAPTIELYKQQIDVILTQYIAESSPKQCNISSILRKVSLPFDQSASSAALAMLGVLLTA
jgi:Regulator of G protein signaling domain